MYVVVDVTTFERHFLLTCSLVGAFLSHELPCKYFSGCGGTRLCIWNSTGTYGYSTTMVFADVLFLVVSGFLTLMAGWPSLLVSIFVLHVRAFVILGARGAWWLVVGVFDFLLFWVRVSTLQRR